MAVSPATSVWSGLDRDRTIEKVEVSLAPGFEAGLMKIQRKGHI
jgi:hypothetical protein